MSVFYQEEQPRQSKRCKFLATVLKEAFSNCRTFNGRRSDSGLEEEYSTSDINDVSQEVVSEIRSRAMEKMKHRPSLVAESFSWVLSPSKQAKGRDKDEREDETDEFFSIGSCFSLCPSAASREAFLSANTDFSRSSSINKIDFRRYGNSISEILGGDQSSTNCVIVKGGHLGYARRLCYSRLCLNPLLSLGLGVKAPN